VASMTWQGGKLRRQPSTTSSFARLVPLVNAEHVGDLEASLKGLAAALKKFGGKTRLQVRIVTGRGDGKLEHWEIEGGAARRKEARKADGIVVTHLNTWLQIVQGHLAPYDALYTGKLRVGGNFELAKSITKHLSDPSAEYVAPCG